MSSPNEYNYDPTSQKVINDLSKVHKGHKRVLAAIASVGSSVSNSTELGRTVTRNGLTYEEFLAGLMYPEETMLVKDYLYFDQVVFNPEPDSPPRTNMTQGRVFITNHRLLLLSAEHHQGLSLSKLFHCPDEKPPGYILTAKATDVLHYQSIPLSGIYSAEFNASVGVLSSAGVYGKRPCCLLAMFSCCGDACQKHWDSPDDAPAAIASNERILTMGVAMPPWGHRYMVQMHLNIGMSLPLVKDYIVALSRFAPNVISTPQNAAF